MTIRERDGRGSPGFELPAPRTNRSERTLGLPVRRTPSGPTMGSGSGRAIESATRGPGSGRAPAAVRFALAVAFLFAAGAGSVLAQQPPAQRPPAPPPSIDPRIVEIVAAASAERLEADIRTLANFGTRNTFSDTLSEVRGIGAARRWIRGAAAAWKSSTRAISGRRPRGAPDRTCWWST